ncbi:hypothetical protein AX16_011037 [Volvariella volvacea WC 439]|nr:hypothetical protein AX16_011037 [Volvariella volvacea WC 439]
MAVSSLAPATLSVEVVTGDSGSIRVAAMNDSSVAEKDSSIPPSLQTYQHYEIRTNLDFIAGAILQQMVIGMDPTSDMSKLSDIWIFPNSNFSKYIVPFPISDETSTTPEIAPESLPPAGTRWRTDALALDPVCEWQANEADSSRLDYLSDGTIDFHDQSRGVSFNLNFTRAVNNSQIFEIYYASASLNKGFTIWDTTNDVPSQGYSVWAVVDRDPVNLNPLPTFATDFLRFAVLICSPGLSIETVEIRSEGTTLSVFPLNTTARVGNLNQRQAELLFTGLFIGAQILDDVIATSSTPKLQVQAGMIFGWPEVAPTSLDREGVATFYPMFAEDIVPTYGTYIRIGASYFMNGVLGQTDVPVMISVLAFTAPRGYVIASTVLVVVLNMINVWAYFRSTRGEVFSLFTVANVLHESRVTDMVREVRKECAGASVDDMLDRLEKESKNRFVTLDDQDTLGLDQRGVGDSVGEREALVLTSPMGDLHRVSSGDRTHSVW